MILLTFYDGVIFEKKKKTNEVKTAALQVVDKQQRL